MGVYHAVGGQSSDQLLQTTMMDADDRDLLETEVKNAIYVYTYGMSQNSEKQRQPISQQSAAGGVAW